MIYKYWTDIIREVFPNADILDAALEYPVTNNGWNLDLPKIEDCRFDDPKYKLFVCLQDWLSEGEKYPSELERAYEYFSKHHVPMDQIIFIVETPGIANAWPKDRFKIIEFSAFNYTTWCEYKAAEDVLREAFGTEHKDFEYNFVCPQRNYKPHRAVLANMLDNRIGNVSLQTKRQELKYPNLSLDEYENTYNNLGNLLSMRKNYNTALFTIVSETQYTETYGVITEKLFNAIVAGHPFLVCAHREYLEHVRKLGFQTYNYIFDEVYDELDNMNRTKEMLHSNAPFVHKKLSAVEMQNIHELCRPIIEFNRDWFFNHYGNMLVDELRIDLLAIWR